MDDVHLKTIGVVCSPVVEKKYTDWGTVISQIQLKQQYVEGLIGLEDYSHIIIFFYMDDFRDQFTNEWKKKPRGISNLDEKGCFAQRTKYRPNPIGISVVEMVSIEDNILTVKGLDANNHSKVLDIKPYIPEFDIREEAHIPSWMKELMFNYF